MKSQLHRHKFQYLETETISRRLYEKNQSRLKHWVKVIRTTQREYGKGKVPVATETDIKYEDGRENYGDEPWV